MNKEKDVIEEIEKLSKYAEIIDSPEEFFEHMQGHTTELSFVLSAFSIVEKAEIIKDVSEKQIEKKAIEIKDRHNFKGEVIYKDGCCPICKNEMSSTYFYCNKCGQKIDWD